MKRFSLVTLCITLLLLFSEVPPQTQAVLPQATKHFADGTQCIPWTPTTCFPSVARSSLRQQKIERPADGSLRTPIRWPAQPRGLKG
jgi:hypothetical protein